MIGVTPVLIISYSCFEKMREGGQNTKFRGKIYRSRSVLDLGVQAEMLQHSGSYVAEMHL
jgi:hypothetical protein